MIEKKVLVWYDPGTAGITSKSFRVFRDCVVETYNHSTALVEVPTEHVCAGFLFIVKIGDGYRVSWTGDGFRTDDGGEGGAGMTAARNLARAFGLVILKESSWRLDDLAAVDFKNYDLYFRKKLEALARRIVEDLIPEDFILSSKRPPEY